MFSNYCPVIFDQMTRSPGNLQEANDRQNTSFALSPIFRFELIPSYPHPSYPIDIP